MKKLVCLFCCFLFTLSLLAQSGSLTGKLQIAETNSPIVGAQVTLAVQGISTTTNQKGEFTLVLLEPMDEEIIISADNYLTQVKVVRIEVDKEIDLGTVFLKPDIQSELKQEVLMQLSENELNDDEGKSQSISSGLSGSARGDVFTSHTSYAFSPVRFRARGYDQEFERTYINGVNFNGQERGTFSYSMIGGLNDASRNKDVVNNTGASSFNYNGMAGSTNILMQATQFAHGWRVAFSGTNRSYKGRLTATYATGLMANGWAFAGSVAWRYSPYVGVKGIISEGTHYNSAAYFFSAEKRIGDDHRISFVTLGAPTERSQSAAVTQEVYDLAGSIYYNPYWGYQNGKVRNSRVVKSFDPTAILSHDWKIDERQSLKTGVGFHYSMYSNSALTFYNAPDPRPDYYRNLPSFLFDGQVDANGNFLTKDASGNLLGSIQEYNGSNFGPTINFGEYKNLTDLWTSRDNATTQINWDNLYQANYSNNVVNPEGSARYMLERRHNNIMETALNSVYTNQINHNLKLTAGVEAKYSKGLHYKTVDDLLGGNQWIDVDPFAERDLNELAQNMGMTQEQIINVKQNDLNNPNASVTEGDKFGYNYDINMFQALLYAQNEWNFNQVDFYYAVKGTFSTFSRYGHMRNGRAEYLAQIYSNGLQPEWQTYYSNLYRSEGKGYDHVFIDPSLKGGVTYKIDGRNHLKANVLAETRAPLARNAYISPRIHDRAIDNLTSSKVLSYDLTYEFNFPIVRGRVTGFRTHILDGSELNGYYDDSFRTFVNQAMTGINRIHQGFEAAVAVKMGMYFTLSAAATVTDQRYTSNAYSITSAENGMALGEDINSNSLYELRDSVLIKGLKVANGPQLATSLKLSYFHPKMWFADLTVSYFDWNYLDFSPSRRMQGMFTGTRADGSTLAYTNGEYKSTYRLETDEQGNVLYDKNGHPIVAYPYSVLSEQESLVSSNILNRFLVDVSVGKLIYLPNRQSLSINLSVSNLLNNTQMKTGGFQQGRIPTSSVQGQDQSVISGNVWKFPAKYYYAWGANFFLNVSYKF